MFFHANEVVSIASKNISVKSLVRFEKGQECVEMLHFGSSMIHNSKPCLGKVVYDFPCLCSCWLEYRVKIWKGSVSDTAN